MRLFPPAVVVGEEEGFTPEKDIFGRKNFGERLTNLVRVIESPAVLVLDAPWGAGKTTFVRMWRGDLTKAGIPSIYFDAFASDYMEDAFLALAGEIVEAAQEERPSDKRLRDFKAAAVKTGKFLLVSAAKIGVKAATLGALSNDDLEELTDIPKSVADEAGELTETFLRNRLEHHKEDKQTLDAFRFTLEQLVESLSPLSADRKTEDDGKMQGSSGRPPLVFVIDELDRCRPPFALDLIEKVKHFFSVPGIVFVIVTNLEQLECAVRFAYGAGIDARSYLEKFYQIKLHLPTERADSHIGQEERYLQHIFSFLPQDGEGGNFSRDLIGVLARMARRKQFTLRRLERVATNAALVLASTKARYLRLAPIVAGLCVLKVDAPELYSKARGGALSYAEVRDVLLLEAWQTEDEPARSEKWTEGWWRYCLGEIEDENQRQKYDSALFDFPDRRPDDLLRLMCTLIDDMSFVPADEAQH